MAEDLRKRANQLAQQASRLTKNWDDENQIAEARKLSQKALEIDSKNQLAWITLGEAMIQEEAFDLAAHALEHARALGAKSARFWHALGLTYTELPGREVQAEEAFDRLLALKPDDADFAADYGHALAEASRRGGRDRPELLQRSAILFACAVHLAPQ